MAKLGCDEQKSIVGHYNLGNLAIDRIAQCLDGKCVAINQARPGKRATSYLGRSYRLPQMRLTIVVNGTS
ncbi:hypothetical protein D8T33_04450 [Vibrio vulnificus]|nr:hypothetical protein D8T33_04450 [Vibrio vulnificus]